MQAILTETLLKLLSCFCGTGTNILIFCAKNLAGDLSRMNSKQILKRFQIGIHNKHKRECIKKKMMKRFEANMLKNSL